jgi:hypothetical protein
MILNDSRSDVGPWAWTKGGRLGLGRSLGLGLDLGLGGGGGGLKQSSLGFKTMTKIALLVKYNFHKLCFASHESDLFSHTKSFFNRIR